MTIWYAITTAVLAIVLTIGTASAQVPHRDKVPVPTPARPKAAPSLLPSLFTPPAVEPSPSDVGVMATVECAGEDCPAPGGDKPVPTAPAPLPAVAPVASSCPGGVCPAPSLPPVRSYAASPVVPRAWGPTTVTGGFVQASPCPGGVCPVPARSSCPGGVCPTRPATPVRYGLFGFRR